MTARACTSAPLYLVYHKQKKCKVKACTCASKAKRLGVAVCWNATARRTWGGDVSGLSRYMHCFVQVGRNISCFPFWTRLSVLSVMLMLCCVCIDGVFSSAATFFRCTTRGRRDRDDLNCVVILKTWKKKKLLPYLLKCLLFSETV